MEILTDGIHFENDFRDAFLLTFPAFTTPLHIIKGIYNRYESALRVIFPELNRKDYKEDEVLAATDIHTKDEAKVVVVRIMNVLKHWIKESGHIEQDLVGDCEAQESLVMLLERVGETTSSESLKGHVIKLQAIVNDIQHRGRMVCQSNTVQDERKPKTRSPGSRAKDSESVVPAEAKMPIDVLNVPPPPTIVRGVTTGSVPIRKKERNRTASTDALAYRTKSISEGHTKTKSKVGSRSQPLSGISPNGLAEQLTLLESERYFCRLRKRELTNRAWTRDNKRTAAPGVIQMIELFDAVRDLLTNSLCNIHIM